MFIVNLDSHQRGVHFRLGRVVGVVGPGLVIVLPVLDRVHKVDLNALLPGWRGLGKDEIARLVIDHVLNSPGTEEGVSEETPGAVAQRGSAARESEEMASARKRKVVLKLFVFLLGLCMASTGGMMLAGEYQSLLQGKAEPLSQTFVVALALTLIGLIVSLQVLVGPLLKRRMVKRQLEDMRIMRKDMVRKHEPGEKEW